MKKYMVLLLVISGCTFLEDLIPGSGDNPEATPTPIVDPTIEPTPIPIETIDVIEETGVIPPWSTTDDLALVGCTSMLKTSDGYKTGFLWKQSEVPDRGVVTFLPRKYNKAKIPLKQVFVMKEGKKIASAYKHSVYTPDKSNRQFWTYSKKAVDFPFNVVAYFGGLCARLENPKVRND